MIKNRLTSLCFYYVIYLTNFVMPFIYLLLICDLKPLLLANAATTTALTAAARTRETQNATENDREEMEKEIEEEEVTLWLEWRGTG